MCKTEAILTRDPDGTLFEEFAKRIVSDFGAKITQQLDGAVITLNLQIYLGIMLFPGSGYEDNPVAGEWVATLAKHLKSTAA